MLLLLLLLFISFIIFQIHLRCCLCCDVCLGFFFFLCELKWKIDDKKKCVWKIYHSCFLFVALWIHWKTYQYRLTLIKILKSETHRRAFRRGFKSVFLLLKFTFNILIIFSRLFSPLTLFISTTHISHNSIWELLLLGMVKQSLMCCLIF